jgi:quercetin dioxygenase-like cupin family protein
MRLPARACRRVFCARDRHTRIAKERRQANLEGEAPMARHILRNSICGTVALIAIGLVALTAVGQEAGEHKVIAVQDIKWSAAPLSVPAGAQAAVLYGDPSKEGTFAFRLKLPKGYHIAPHTHPKPEIVTVISGTARLGMGTSVDHASAQVLPAGSFFALTPGSAHYFFADDETVIQLNSNGPWGINYINPKDDPRQKTQ